jgi:hypothetical protein
MARQRAYLFCRYQILKDEAALRPSEEWKLLETVRGKTIAYRVRDPKGGGPRYSLSDHNKGRQDQGRIDR